MSDLCLRFWLTSREFLIRVLETRASEFVSFKKSLQKLIEDVFLPAEVCEIIAHDLSMLQDAVEEEIGENYSNTNNTNDMKSKMITIRGGERALVMDCATKP